MSVHKHEEWKLLVSVHVATYSILNMLHYKFLSRVRHLFYCIFILDILYKLLSFLIMLRQDYQQDSLRNILHN